VQAGEIGKHQIQQPDYNKQQEHLSAVDGEDASFFDCKMNQYCKRQQQEGSKYTAVAVVGKQKGKQEENEQKARYSIQYTFIFTHHSSSFLALFAYKNRLDAVIIGKQRRYPA
jgi:hypothetical protein